MLLAMIHSTDAKCYVEDECVLHAENMLVATKNVEGKLEKGKCTSLSMKISAAFLFSYLLAVCQET